MATVAPSVSYDRVPYAGQPFRLTYPPHLETIGTLFGLTPSSASKARVLELGCGEGSNCIPYAYAYPHSSVVGIDLSSTQIDTGRALVKSLGLQNIRLESKSISALTATDGPFDYIICHGVYSWVSPQVREEILTLCRELLSPSGIAYISYNTLPGWHFRGLWREVMLHHAEQSATPEERAKKARAMLTFCAESVLQKEPLYAKVLKAGVDQIREFPDWYLLHDFLEEHNEPLYFSAFIEEIKKHGLQYIADAELSKWFPIEYPQNVQATLRQLTNDRIRYEQYVDLLSNRMFRRSLICKNDCTILRAPRFTPLTPYRITSHLRYDVQSSAQGVPTFRDTKGGALQSKDPLTIEALRILEKHSPASIPYQELVQETLSSPTLQTLSKEQAESTLSQGIIRGVTADFISLTLGPDPFTVVPSTSPQGSLLAQAQLAAGLPLTNLLHTVVELNPLEKAIFPLLNGKRDIATLAHELRTRDFDRMQSDPQPDEIQEILKGLGEKALLVLC